VKLRTFDNLYIRIPNETIIKTNLVNITRFPVRRLEIAFNVPYTEDVARIRELLTRLAFENVYCLQNPAPLFLIGDLNTNGINISFLMWFEKTKIIELKNSFLETMLVAFKQEQIAFSAQRVVVAGSN
jgi:small-conductance mechanosensitive channel